MRQHIQDNQHQQGEFPKQFDVCRNIYRDLDLPQSGPIRVRFVQIQDYGPRFQEGAKMGAETKAGEIVAWTGPRIEMATGAKSFGTRRSQNPPFWYHGLKNDLGKPGENDDEEDWRPPAILALLCCPCIICANIVKHVVSLIYYALTSSLFLYVPMGDTLSQLPILLSGLNILKKAATFDSGKYLDKKFNSDRKRLGVQRQKRLQNFRKVLGKSVEAFVKEGKATRMCEGKYAAGYTTHFAPETSREGYAISYDARFVLIGKFLLIFETEKKMLFDVAQIHTASIIKSASQNFEGMGTIEYVHISVDFRNGFKWPGSSYGTIRYCHSQCEEVMPGWTLNEDVKSMEMHLFLKDNMEMKSLVSDLKNLKQDLSQLGRFTVANVIKEYSYKSGLEPIKEKISQKIDDVRSRVAFGINGGCSPGSIEKMIQQSREMVKATVNKNYTDECRRKVVMDIMANKRWELHGIGAYPTIMTKVVKFLDEYNRNIGSSMLEFHMRWDLRKALLQDPFVVVLEQLQRAQLGIALLYKNNVNSRNRKTIELKSWHSRCTPIPNRDRAAALLREINSCWKAEIAAHEKECASRLDQQASRASRSTPAASRRTYGGSRSNPTRVVSRNSGSQNSGSSQAKPTCRAWYCRAHGPKGNTKKCAGCETLANVAFATLLLEWEMEGQKLISVTAAPEKEGVSSVEKPHGRQASARSRASTTLVARTCQHPVGEETQKISCNPSEARNENTMHWEIHQDQQIPTLDILLIAADHCGNWGWKGKLDAVGQIPRRAQQVHQGGEATLQGNRLDEINETVQLQIVDRTGFRFIFKEILAEIFAYDGTYYLAREVLPVNPYPAIIPEIEAIGVRPADARSDRSKRSIFKMPILTPLEGAKNRTKIGERDKVMHCNGTLKVCSAKMTSVWGLEMIVGLTDQRFLAALSRILSPLFEFQKEEY
eukprot:jgi/Bigna1/77324/fgenesh1_pg.47_\